MTRDAAPLLVAEPTNCAWDHAPFNAATLRAVADAFPGRRIIFAASARHREAVFESDGDLRALEQRTIDVLPPGGITRARFLAQWRAVGGAVRATGARTTLLLSGGPETFFVARLLASLDRELRLFIVLHGMGPEDFSWRSRDPRRRLFDFRAGMGWAQHERIRFIALEEHVADALVPRLGLYRRPLVWPHPLPDDINATRGVAEPAAPLRIAFPGTAHSNKGFALFTDAARQFGSGDLVFELVGYSPANRSDHRPVAYEAPTAPLPRAAYVERLRQAHFALLPLQPDVYKLTASGSLMDCVAMGLPLITTANDAALAMEKEFGSVGYIFRDEAELAALLRAPETLGNATRHQAFREALGRAAAARGQAALAARIRMELAG